MVPITALVGKDTLGMENHAKVNNLPIVTIGFLVIEFFHACA